MLRIRGQASFPCARFNSTSRLHIVFTDYAAQHCFGSGAWKYDRCVCHAVQSDGKWTFRTVFKHAEPIHKQFVESSFALVDGRLFVLCEQRHDTFGPAPKYCIQQSDCVLW
ncbi:MAG TPA: hypothetical protein P5055_17540, partial [Candidatus Paceibacterota bacterium]|nr:hypothetical protein [Candidatus Paceibacterota bacterium]